MDNFDLDISNYSIDDLKNFLNIDALSFDYADLQKSVKKKNCTNYRNSKI